MPKIRGEIMVFGDYPAMLVLYLERGDLFLSIPLVQDLLNIR